MSRLTAFQDGDISGANFYPEANTPTLHATTNVTVGASKIYSATFTAPNTSNYAYGAWICVITIAGTTGYSITIGLQENGADASPACNSTVACADIGVTGWHWFKFGTPYKFTSTTPGYYRLYAVRSGSGTTSPQLAYDSGGANFAYACIYNAPTTPAATDDLWIGGDNSTGTRTMTYSTTTANVGSGTDTTGQSRRTLGMALWITNGGLLKADTTASTTLTVKGNPLVSGSAANPGELRRGSATSGGYPTNQVSTFLYNENGVGGNYGLETYDYGKATDYGEPKLGPSTYVSGTGTVGNPLITAAAIGVANDICAIMPTSNDTYNSQETEMFTIATKNSSTSYVITPINLDTIGYSYNGNGGDFELPGGTIWYGWTNTVGTGAIADETTIVHTSPGHSAKLTAGSSVNTEIDHTISYKFKPSTNYTITFWTYGDGTHSGRFRVYDVTNSAYINALTDTALTAASWNQYTYNFTTPANCYSVRLYLYCPATNGAICYFDDVVWTPTTPALVFTHTNAPIVNLTRNVIVSTTNKAYGYYEYLQAIGSNCHTSNWAAYNFGGNSISGAKGVTRYQYGASVALNMSNCIFGNPLGLYGFDIYSSKTTDTYTNNILWGNPNYGYSATYALYMSACANKTFTNTYIFSNYNYASNLSGTGMTFNYYYAYANNMIMTVGPRCGANLSGLIQSTLNNAEIHSNFANGIIVSTNSIGITWNNCNVGTKGNNTVDFSFGTNTSQYVTMVFNSCYFSSTNGYDTTYQNQTNGSKLEFYNYNGSSGTYFFLQPTSMATKDAVTSKNSTTSTRMDALTSTAFSKTLPLLCKNGVAYSITGNVRYNAVYRTAGSYTAPSVVVSGLGITPQTFTATVDVGHDDTWQPYTLNFTQSSGADGNLTVTESGQASDITASLYFDGLIDSPLVTSARFYGYTFDDTNPLRTVNPYVVLSESAANALTGIAIDYTGHTVTISSNHTMSEIYDYTQAQSCVTANLSNTVPITTADGNNFSMATDWGIVINTGVTVTASGKKLTMSGTGTYTITGTGDFTGTLADASTTRVKINVTGIVNGSRLQIYDTTASAELFNDLVTTSKSLTFIHTGADHGIRIRLMYVSGSTTAYSWYTATGTVTTSGLSLNAAQVENTTYETAGVDGSTVTECSVSGTTVRIYVDDPDNTTTAQRIYNWYQYYLFTSAGIANQDGAYITATDATHYIFQNVAGTGMKIVNQDTSNPLQITGANITPSDGGTATKILDVTNGASIVLNFNRVEGFSYSSGSGLSTEEHNALFDTQTKVSDIKIPIYVDDGVVISK